MFKMCIGKNNDHALIILICTWKLLNVCYKNVAGIYKKCRMKTRRNKENQKTKTGKETKTKKDIKWKENV